MRLNKIILFAMAVSFLFITSSIAIVVNPPAIVRDFTSPGTYYHSSGNLAYFAVDHVMTFTQVVVASSYVQFNNTKFNISSPNRINISLDYLDADMTGSSGDTLISFYAQTTTGNARFNISNMTAGVTYAIYKNNASMTTSIANATGSIYFNNSVWTTAYFEILLTGTLPSVTTNASTGVEETNATLNCYVVSSGSFTTAFQYGQSISYGNTVASANGIYYNESSFSSYGNIVTTSWYAQTFTTGDLKSSIKNVSLYLSRVGTPGNISAFIRAIDGSGKPTGTNLSIGRLNANTNLPLFPLWKWVNINLSSNSLNGNTVYALILSSNGTNVGTECVRWGTKSPGTFSGGNIVYSVNSGTTWTIQSNNDFFGFYITLQSNSYNLSSLTPGQLYHYRAYATNSNGTSYGSDRTFVTKPNAPDTASFTIVSNTRSLGLNWTKATGANTTLILRKQGAYPLTKTDGTIVYNGTGSSYTNTGLTPGVGYGYRAWSYTVYGTTWQFSDANATGCEITKPEGPLNGKATITGMNPNGTLKMRLNWTKAASANTTIVVKKTTGYPTSWTDGTIIYNSTGLFKDVDIGIGATDYYRAWSYAAWIINPHLYETSINGTTISLPGGGLLINAFDENDHHNLTFNVKVSNQSGSKVYENTSCTNTLVINATLCPQGPNIQVIVSATGYHQRIYTLDIYPGIIYLLNAYLPPETAPGNGTENCELRPYIDSATITNHAVDAVITFTHTLDSMISVEIYNASLYGTYGGWIFVASDKYSFTTTSVTINETVLDANTTMARVSYYYNFCEGGVESALYNLRVIESIKVGDTQIDQAVENVLVQVKRYINSTGIFVDVSSIFTDANGYVNLYMVPDAHYKIFLNKSGYDDVIGADYIPAPPNAFGQTEEKVFRIVKITEVAPPVYDWFDYITFTGTMNNATAIVYVNFTDALTNTTDWQLFIYQIDPNSTTAILVASWSGTNDSFTLSKNVTDSTSDYTIVFHMNHSNLGFQSIERRLFGYHHKITSAARFNLLFTLNYGYNPFGWANTFMFFVILGCFFSFGRRDTYISVFAIGFILLFLNFYIGIETVWSALSGGGFPMILILFGILMLIRDRGFSGAN